MSEMEFVRIISGYEDLIHIVNYGDLSLCGEDIAGDTDREIIFEGNKITCHRCIELIKFCKSIKAKYITQGE
jgi:hypothetical protein